MTRSNHGPFLLFAILSATSLFASQKQFDKPVYYKLGFHDFPYAMVAAHLTQSGNLDLVTTDYPTDNHVSIFLGNGDGTFQTPARFSVPAPVALATADFNGDGNQDLAVVEYGSPGQIVIYLGDGTGKFKKSASYACGIQPTSVAIADFNGDGKMDLAIADNGGYVSVFFGTGDGKLMKKPVKYQLDRTPYSVAAADLNGDGHPDLAVSNIDGYVSVLINDGSGKFAKAVNYTTVGEGAYIQIADLRRNGKQDLIIAGASVGLEVLLNHGDGTFGDVTVYPSNCNNCVPPEACVLADFNLDNDLDVACATNYGDSYLFYGNGKGGFGNAQPFNETINNHGGYSIAAGDFDNNGAPDIAIPIWDKGKVAIMLNAK
jgi:hypothetical protein